MDDEYEIVRKSIVEKASGLDSISECMLSIRAKEWADASRALAKLSSGTISSYSLAGRSVTRANLSDLERRVSRLWAEIGSMVDIPSMADAPCWCGISFRGLSGL